MPALTHALGRETLAEETRSTRPIDRVRWISEPLRHQEIKRKESIVARGAFYVGVAATGVLNVHAQGSPIESFLGAFTLLANVGVGAAFIWALIEPPHIETVPYRSRNGKVRRLLNRLVLPFALGDVIAPAAKAARTPDATGCLLASREATR